jgi:hypothetical protein
VAFGNNFTTSFAEEYKDRGAAPRGLSESMTVWFMGGENKITLTLSGAEVPQVSRARFHILILTALFVQHYAVGQKHQQTDRAKRVSQWLLGFNKFRATCQTYQKSPR